MWVWMEAVSRALSTPVQHNQADLAPSNECDYEAAAGDQIGVLMDRFR